MGALLTAGYGWVSDARRWHREDRVRRQQEKREDEFRDYQERKAAYAEYLAVADNIVMSGATEERMLRHERLGSDLLFVAPVRVIERSVEVDRGVRAYGRTFLAAKRAGKSEAEAAALALEASREHDFANAKNRYIGAAREDLGKDMQLPSSD